MILIDNSCDSIILFGVIERVNIMLPSHYPEPNVPEINLGTEAFSEEIPPHIPISSGLGEALVKTSGPYPGAIMRRALRENGAWSLDKTFSISMFVPDENKEDAVAVIEKNTPEQRLRDYYQIKKDVSPEYAARLMALRPEAAPNERWFVSVVNCEAVARKMEELGVGAESRKICDMLNQPPDELSCFGTPDSVEQESSPASDLFETNMDDD